mmetsp:Transcript_46936/g.84629  ORF Transcript_46936/g.84629 Transcript_46936/m.84629 type:complete len:211 (-) Transcript_46936:65-697(-)
MQLTRLWICKKLATEALVGSILVASSLMGVAQPPSIRYNHAHDAIPGHEQPVAVWTFKHVGWIFFASGSMLVPRSWIWEELSAVATISGILLACHFMHVTILQTIAAFKSKNVERRDISSRTKPAFEAVRRVHLALHCVSNPCIGIGKDLATPALVRRIFLAANLVLITQLPAVFGEEAKGRAELLRAKLAFKLVCRVHRATGGVIVPGG